MEKNTVLAIVLSSIVLIVFMVLQSVLFPPVPVQNISETAAETVNITENKAAEMNSAEKFSAEPAENESEEKYTINTEKFNVVFTNRGGDIIGLELLDHKDKTRGVEMADNISEKNRAFSLSLGNYENAVIDDIFNVKIIDDYTIGFFKRFRVKTADNSSKEFTLIKEYAFAPDDYMLKLDIRIESNENLHDLNFSDAAYTLRSSPQIGPHYDRKKDRYENRTFMTYSDGKRKKQILNDGTVKTFDKPYTWTGVGGKYFTMLIVPENISSMKNAVYSTLVENGTYANAQVMLTRKPIDQKSVHDVYYIYAGPRTDKMLSKYNNAAENSWKLSSLRLNDSLQSSGMLSWLEIFLKWIMELFYKLIPNWGISIIIMTVLLKAAFFPLTKKSSEATLKMQAMQPKMQELQTKYKDNPEKLNIEMAKFYKEAGYNPLSGCLPLLIQFPLIIAMFNLFNNYFEFRGAMFIPGWIPDLSVGDSICTLSFSIPFIGDQIRILPIVYVFSQLLYGKITQTANAAAGGAQMKFMMYGMPVMFFFLFYNAPAGLILYWTVSNLLQLIQQVIINKSMKAKKAI
ncbi:MAG: membrane protein insertase YidC [Bacteroides sp.]|nr:membrane protein insertase YidC [Prevotella sp.]MCM1408819.1 membrane protein insertase YidC [Treponema brennaborense]MCM1470599.1 membrane protein insertase YidC [Bacteroides sp.]